MQREQCVEPNIKMNGAAEDEGDNLMMCCAACGSVGDGAKLQTCTACKSVRYCGVTCQRNHWRQHKRACKERAAELHDEILFKQPESSHLGDCPICCLPLPLAAEKSTMMPCCCKIICSGCILANERRMLEGVLEGRLEATCPFCRHPKPSSDEESYMILKKRVEVNDPAALTQMVEKLAMDGDHNRAFQYLTKAAALGNVTAHFHLAYSYQHGEGVEKDETKRVYHFEKAAIGGHAFARCHLGCYESKNGKLDRAVKHFVIAANMGHDQSMEILTAGFKKKHKYVTKEVLAAALRAHQDAVDATKSPQREEAEKEMAGGSLGL